MLEPEHWLHKEFSSLLSRVSLLYFSECSLVKVDYHYQDGKLVNGNAFSNYKAVKNTISKYLEGKMLSTPFDELDCKDSGFAICYCLSRCFNTVTWHSKYSWN